MQSGSSFKCIVIFVPRANPGSSTVLISNSPVPLDTHMLASTSGEVLDITSTVSATINEL